MIRTVVFVIACMCIALGCNSGTDDAVSCPEPFSGPLSSEEEPWVGVWKLTGAAGSTAIDLTDDNEDNPDTDLFGQLGECEQQASYVFTETRAASYYASELELENCVEKLLFDGTWKLEAGNLFLVAGCFNLQAEAALGPEMNTFSFTVFETVRNFREQEISMEVTYTFTRAVTR